MLTLSEISRRIEQAFAPLACVFSSDNREYRLRFRLHDGVGRSSVEFTSLVRLIWEPKALEQFIATVRDEVERSGFQHR